MMRAMAASVDSDLLERHYVSGVSVEQFHDLKHGADFVGQENGELPDQWSADF